MAKKSKIPSASNNIKNFLIRVFWSSKKESYILYGNNVIRKKPIKMAIKKKENMGNINDIVVKHRIILMDILIIDNGVFYK